MSNTSIAAGDTNPLAAFLATEEGASLRTGYERAIEILKREHWDLPRVMATRGEQGIPQTGEEDPLSMVEEPAIAQAVAEMASGSAAPVDAPPEELALAEALDRAEPVSAVAIVNEDVAAALKAVALLRVPVEAFLGKISVNHADDAVRARRLNILSRFQGTLDRVFDFARSSPGGKGDSSSANN